MKPIETKWKGYRFRSRTEARWAVFFETAGIEFEYEPEGFILPSGPYLPDFKLRTYVDLRSLADVADRKPPQVVEVISFLEVKGEMPTDEEVQKCGELRDYIKAGSVRSPEVFIAVGAPDTIRRVFPVGNKLSSGGERAPGYTIFEDEPGAFATAGDFGSLGLTISHGDYDWVLCPIGYRSREEAMRPFVHDFPTFPSWMRQAYDASRSARFEFGETDQRWDR